MSRLPSTITVGTREINVGLTAADHLINWLNPNQLGGRREMSADSAIIPDLITLREESQNLARNNSIAAGALKTNVTKVVGTGLRVKAKVDRSVLRLSDEQADAWERAAEREYILATENREIDAERELPMSLLQGLVFLRVLEDGDLLVNLPHINRPGSPYRTKLQLIEAARICNPDFKPDSETMVAGVQKDSLGAPELFHVISRHPGNLRYPGQGKKQFTWSQIKAFDRNGAPLALHLKDKTRPGQTRGVPYLAPVIELIKQLGRYTDAEVMAAVVTGMLTVFVYNESGNPEFGRAPTAGDPSGDRSAQIDPTGLELGYGSVIGLRDGQRVEAVGSPRPNTAFDPFFIAITRQIGMCLELPFEVLVKHFTASYSAARAALLDAWEYFKRRRHWLASQFCQPVYEAIITEAVITGRLAAPGFLFDPLLRRAWLGTRWVGDAPGEIDPVKAVEAAKGRVELLLTTLDEERESLIGGDHEAIQPQILREHAWKNDNGLNVAKVQPAEPAQEPTTGDE
jgi:lambda family phage portal protein